MALPTENAMKSGLPIQGIPLRISSGSRAIPPSGDIFFTNNVLTCVKTTLTSVLTQLRYNRGQTMAWLAYLTLSSGYGLREHRTFILKLKPCITIGVRLK